MKRFRTPRNRKRAGRSSSRFSTARRKRAPSGSPKPSGGRTQSRRPRQDTGLFLSAPEAQKLRFQGRGPLRYASWSTPPKPRKTRPCCLPPAGNPGWCVLPSQCFAGHCVRGLRGGGGPAYAPACCDKSRVKTREKEKQYSFLTNNCHNRQESLGRTVSTSTGDTPASNSLAGRPLNPIRQGPPPASRRRLSGAPPPPAVRDARQAGTPRRWEEGGKRRARLRGASLL